MFLKNMSCNYHVENNVGFRKRITNMREIFRRTRNNHIFRFFFNVADNVNTKT